MWFISWDEHKHQLYTATATKNTQEKEERILAKLFTSYIPEELLFNIRTTILLQEWEKHIRIVFNFIERNAVEVFWFFPAENIITHPYYHIHWNILLFLIGKIILNLIRTSPADNLCVIFLRVIVSWTEFAFEGKFITAFPIPHNNIRIAVRFWADTILTDVTRPVSHAEVIVGIKQTDNILFKEFAFLLKFSTKLCIRLVLISRKLPLLIHIKKVNDFFQKTKETHGTYISLENIWI